MLAVYTFLIIGVCILFYAALIVGFIAVASAVLIAFICCAILIFYFWVIEGICK